jgi:hypothetical protein
MLTGVTDTDFGVYHLHIASTASLWGPVYQGMVRTKVRPTAETRSARRSIGAVTRETTTARVVP